MNDSAQIARARRKLVYGAAAKTTIAGLELSLNFVSTPGNIGVLEFAPASGPGAVAGTPFQLDPLGIRPGSRFAFFERALRTVTGFVLNHDWPLPPDLRNNFFARGPFHLAITRVFPAEDIFGGSAGYHLKPEQFYGARLLQGFFHIEATFTEHKEYSFQLKRRPEGRRAGDRADLSARLVLDSRRVARRVPGGVLV